MLRNCRQYVPWVCVDYSPPSDNQYKHDIVSIGCILLLCCMANSKLMPQSTITSNVCAMQLTFIVVTIHL